MIPSRMLSELPGESACRLCGVFVAGHSSCSSSFDGLRVFLFTRDRAHCKCSERAEVEHWKWKRRSLPVVFRFRVRAGFQVELLECHDKRIPRRRLAQGTSRRERVGGQKKRVSFRRDLLGQADQRLWIGGDQQRRVLPVGEGGVGLPHRLSPSCSHITLRVLPKKPRVFSEGSPGASTSTLMDRRGPKAACPSGGSADRCFFLGHGSSTIRVGGQKLCPSGRSADRCSFLGHGSSTIRVGDQKRRVLPVGEGGVGLPHRLSPSCSHITLRVLPNKRVSFRRDLLGLAHQRLWIGGDQKRRVLPVDERVWGFLIASLQVVRTSPFVSCFGKSVCCRGSACSSVGRGEGRKYSPRKTEQASLSRYVFSRVPDVVSSS
jgi:uncharacterized Zn-binding protein involved in type VI secretion